MIALARPRISWDPLTSAVNSPQAKHKFLVTMIPRATLLRSLPHTVVYFSVVYLHVYKLSTSGCNRRHYCGFFS